METGIFGIGLGTYLALASILFGIGAVGFLTRKNLLLQLMSIEIMLNSVNLLLVSFNRYRADDGSHAGQVMAFFVIAIAAAEAAVGLAILIGFYKLKKSVDSDRADLLRH